MTNVATNTEQFTAEQIALLESICPTWCGYKGTHNWASENTNWSPGEDYWNHCASFGNPLGRHIAPHTVNVEIDVQGKVVEVLLEDGFNTDPQEGLRAAANFAVAVALHGPESVQALAAVQVDRHKVEAVMLPLDSAAAALWHGLTRHQQLVVKAAAEDAYILKARELQKK